MNTVYRHIKRLAGFVQDKMTAQRHKPSEDQRIAGTIVVIVQPNFNIYVPVNILLVILLAENHSRRIQFIAGLSHSSPVFPILLVIQIRGDQITICFRQTAAFCFHPVEFFLRQLAILVQHQPVHLPDQCIKYPLLIPDQSG